MVEPVVVRPDMASKYASVNDSSGIAIISGIAADADISVHDSDTSRKPSRGLSSRRKRRVPAASPRPTQALISAAVTKSITAPSCTSNDQAMGSTYSIPKKAIMRPSTWATASTFVPASATARAREQAFDLFDVPAIRKENDHVVVVHDLRVM